MSDRTHRRVWIHTRKEMQTYYIVAPHITDATRPRISFGLPEDPRPDANGYYHTGVRKITLPRVSILERYDEKGNPR